MSDKPQEDCGYRRITYTAEQIKKLAEIYIANKRLSSSLVVAVDSKIFDFATDLYGYEVVLEFLEKFQKVKNQSVQGIMDEFWSQFSSKDQKPFPI